MDTTACCHGYQCCYGYVSNCIEATACESHCVPSSPVNVTDENGDEIALRSRSQTELTTPVSTPPSAGDLRNHSSSFSIGVDRQLADVGGPGPGPSESLRGGVACPDPVASAVRFSPFRQKSLPTVAKNEATSTGVSYGAGGRARGDVGMASTQLVMGGEDSMDFMKLSFCAPPQMPPMARGGAPSQQHWGRPAGNFARPLGGKFRPVLLFIPLRLGQESFNHTYASSLKVCMATPL